MNRPLVIELLGVILELGIDSQSDRHFQVVISGFIKTGVMNEGELADFLLVSRPSINRWSRGKNLPRKAMRRAIYKALAEKLDKN